MVLMKISIMLQHIDFIPIKMVFNDFNKLSCYRDRSAFGHLTMVSFFCTSAFLVSNSKK